MLSRLLPVNEHHVDRVLRVGLGLTMIGATLAGSIGLWGYVGVIPLVTGLVGSCPIYTLFGLSTCPISTRTKTT